VSRFLETDLPQLALIQQAIEDPVPEVIRIQQATSRVAEDPTRHGVPTCACIMCLLLWTVPVQAAKLGAAPTVDLTTVTQNGDKKLPATSFHDTSRTQ